MWHVFEVLSCGFHVLESWTSVQLLLLLRQFGISDPFRRRTVKRSIRTVIGAGVPKLESSVPVKPFDLSQFLSSMGGKSRRLASLMALKVSTFYASWSSRLAMDGTVRNLPICCNDHRSFGLEFLIDRPVVPTCWHSHHRCSGLSSPWPQSLHEESVYLSMTFRCLLSHPCPENHCTNRPSSALEHLRSCLDTPGLAPFGNHNLDCLHWLIPFHLPDQ